MGFVYVVQSLIVINFSGEINLKCSAQFQGLVKDGFSFGCFMRARLDIIH